MQITRYESGSPLAPPTLRPCTDAIGDSAVSLIGDPTLLDRKPTALFCSVQCPGDLILKSYDLARALRAHPITLIGGFQSPIEKEFLELLLRQPVTQPDHTPPPLPSVIICPARGLANMRIHRPWRDPLAAGRLLLLSTFPDSLRRPTGASASRRNACVAALAHRTLILHAAQGGKTEALCRQALAAAKPVHALPSPHNAHLIALGAQPIPSDDPSVLMSA
ncbi:MAG: hypothetical protein OXI80_08340 [Caldilineaceae bacterium]|nr:hypothetical protein [Caldilineaceae bacterium]MDE0337666.1 hypothetical protein [Caldilineaceae bacterium]